MIFIVIVSAIVNLTFASGLVIPPGQGSNYLNITANGTTTIKSGAGVLFAVCVNTLINTASLVLYDNTAGSGTKIGTFVEVATVSLTGTNTWSPVCQQIGGANFAIGLTAVASSGPADWTVYYR